MTKVLTITKNVIIIEAITEIVNHEGGEMKATGYSIRIKELRIERNLTQRELAELLGLQQSAISKFELRKLEPNIQLIIDIANLFNVTTDYLLGRTQYRTRKRKNTYIQQSIFYLPKIDTTP